MFLFLNFSIIFIYEFDSYLYPLNSNPKSVNLYTCVCVGLDGTDSRSWSIHFFPHDGHIHDSY